MIPLWCFVTFIKRECLYTIEMEEGIYVVTESIHILFTEVC